MITLKEILSVPSKTGQEQHLRKWICNVLKGMKISHFQDKSGNIYATKGTSEFYPCISAHLDTVHNIERIIIEEDENGYLYGLNENKEPTGCGGDDKCGVYICLQLLQKLDICKVAFFVSEENGCIGANNSNFAFFKDVAYVIEFDSPCDTIMSFSNDGVQLFDTKGKFFDIISPIVLKHGIDQWQHHPYTDVSVLKRRHDFPCLNLPAGYFRAHTPNEYVVPGVVQRSIEMGLELIAALGNQKFHYNYEKDREVTRFVPSLSEQIDISNLFTHDYGMKIFEPANSSCSYAAIDDWRYND